MAPSRSLQQATRYVCASCAAKSGIRRLTTSALRHNASPSSALPRVAKPSFWASLVPKAFRQPTSPLEAAERERQRVERASRPKTRNPYLSFIVLALIVGSNAINMIALRNETADFRRKSSARIETLKDVIRRVRAGEDVDVKKELGTGDPRHEAEWDEVMQELAGHHAVEAAKRKKDLRELDEAAARKRESAASQRTAGDGDQTQNPGERQARPKFIM